MADVTASTNVRDRWLRRLVRLPLDYCVVLGVVAVGALATQWVRADIGDDPTRAEMTRYGFGLPPLLDGRWWTLLSGMALTWSLAPPLPIFTLIGVGLYEHVARHWRAVVVLVGGQVLGVLVVSLLLWPFDGSDDPWLAEITTTVDFGISVGGFACLGAWTAHLAAPWRRRMRLGLSCYFVGPLLLSGLIFDLTHPMGWVIGLGLGALLVNGTDHPYDPAPLERRELPWLVAVATAGAVAGAVAGWTGGGIGGVFGWGPGRPGG